MKSSFCLLWFTGILISSCAYHFTLGARPHKGRYQSLYVARSLNPSGSLLPLEVLEEELQKSFIQNLSDIHLVSEPRADLFLRFVVHQLDDALFSETEQTTESLSFDSSSGLKTESGKLKHPLKQDNLKKSNYGLVWETMKLSVTLELWDLKTRQRVFSKNYSQDQRFRVLFSASSRMIELHQKEEEILRNVSKKMVRTIIDDLILVL